MTVIKFNKDKHVERPQACELFERIDKLIYEYVGELGVAEVIGILELNKLEVYRSASENEGE